MEYAIMWCLEARGSMKLNWKVLIVLVVGPLIGAVSGFIFATLYLPSDPDGSYAAIHGFIGFMFVALGFSAALVVSLLIVARMVYLAKRGKHSK